MARRFSYCWWVAIPLVFFVLALYVKWDSEVHTEEEFESPSPHAQSAIHDEITKIIKATKFELFQKIVNKSISHPYQPSNKKIAPSISWDGEETIVNAVENRHPVVITNSSAARWKALQWDLWQFSLAFPLILGAVIKDHSHHDSTIWIQDERDVGGMVTVVDESVRSDIEEEFWLVYFIASFQNPKIRMFYSSSYSLLEQLLPVKSYHFISLCSIVLFNIFLFLLDI